MRRPAAELENLKKPPKRKIILSVAVSLDGYVEGPNGEYDWYFIDKDYSLKEFFKRIDTIFVGRKTYEISSEMEGGPPGFPKFKEYIFSTTLDSVKKGATLIKEKRKKEKGRGRDIWLFGSAGLTTSLMNLGLVDELLLAFYPILLGSCKLLFKNIADRIHLTLLKQKLIQQVLFLYDIL